MSKTLLAIAMALALAGPLVATAHDHTPAASYTMGVHGAPDWSVHVVNPRFDAVALTRQIDAVHGQFGEHTGEGIARAIGAYYAKAGAAQVSIRVNEATHTVDVIEGHTAGSTGAYAGYLPATQHATRRQIEVAGRNISNRARADGQRATLDIAKPGEDGLYTVDSTATRTDDSRLSGTLGYTNQGARYAGSDLLTGSARVEAGAGFEIDASVAHGLSNASSDSFGGRYDSESLSVTHYSRFGGTKFYATNTTYQTGGPLRDFDLSGHVSTYGLQQIVPLSKAWTGYVGIQNTRSNERLGVVDWNDHERYTTALIGFSRDTEHTNGNIEFDHGVGGGHRSYTLAPLQGTFDPRYSSVKASFSAWTPIGANWVGRAGVAGQVSSHDTPTNELWTIGGPFRGQAYKNGFTAGIRGYSVWGQVEAPVWHGLTPYVGVDRAVAAYAIGPDTRVNSGYAGLRYRLASRLSLDVGYAHAFGPTPDGEDGHRVLANLSVSL
jgi:hemolysin activation/secretion protein